NAEGETSAVPHLDAAGVDELRQALSAMFDRRRQRVPAAGGPDLIGLLEARRRGDGTVAQLRAMTIAPSVDRREHILRDAGALLENVLDHVDRHVGIDAVVYRAIEIGDVAHHEQHVFDRGTIGHCESSIRSSPASARADRCKASFPLAPSYLGISVASPAWAPFDTIPCGMLNDH